MRVKPFRILTIADIHGNLTATKKLVTHLKDKSSKIDLIIIAGDLPATTSLSVMARYMLRHPFKALSKILYTEWVYKGKGRQFFVDKQNSSSTSILEELSVFQVPIVYIPGNVDTYEVLKTIGDHQNIEINVLDTHPIVIESLSLVGIGGALVRPLDSTPLCDHEFSTEQYTKRWEKLKLQRNEEKTDYSINSIDILLSHEPPAFEALQHEDKVVKIGSPIVSKIIKNLKPRLVIFGHYHELPLVYQAPKVTYVNPGPLACYYYSLIDITSEKIKVSLNKISPAIIDPINKIYQHRSSKNSLYNNLRFV